MKTGEQNGMGAPKLSVHSLVRDEKPEQLEEADLKKLPKVACTTGCPREELRRLEQEADGLAVQEEDPPAVPRACQETTAQRPPRAASTKKTAESASMSISMSSAYHEKCPEDCRCPEEQLSQDSSSNTLDHKHDEDDSDDDDTNVIAHLTESAHKRSAPNTPSTQRERRMHAKKCRFNGKLSKAQIDAIVAATNRGDLGSGGHRVRRQCGEPRKALSRCCAPAFGWPGQRHNRCHCRRRRARQQMRIRHCIHAGCLRLYRTCSTNNIPNRRRWDADMFHQACHKAATRCASQRKRLIYQPCPYWTSFPLCLRFRCVLHQTKGPKRYRW